MNTKTFIEILMSIVRPRPIKDNTPIEAYIRQKKASRRLNRYKSIDYIY